MANLLVVDSQTAMRTGIKLLISDRYPDWTVYQFKTAMDFFDSNLDVVPEIIMLGIDMENENTNLKQLLIVLNKLSHSSLVVCGEYLSNSKIESMFKSGILGYVSRKASEKEFIECFDAVRRGGKYCALDHIKSIGI